MNENDDHKIEINFLLLFLGKLLWNGIYSMIFKIF